MPATTYRFVVPPPVSEPLPGRVPTFSVVIAAYRAERTIASAVESALGQDPAPLEVVARIDGDSEATTSALEPFAERVQVLHSSERRGQANAKNAAAAVCSGDFVVILDADDIFLPGRLAALGALACQRPDLDILTTDAYLVYEGERIGTIYDDAHRFETVDQRSGILERNFVFGLAAIRRDAFLAVGGFSEDANYTTDWDCWIRMILSGSQAGLVDAPLAEYRLHAASMNARRLAIVEGRIVTLKRAARDPSLAPAEHAIVARRIAEEDRRASWERLLETFDPPPAWGPEVRRSALPVFRDRGQPRAFRARALAALIAPRLAAREFRRRRVDVLVTVGDRRLPRT